MLNKNISTKFLSDKFFLLILFLFSIIFTLFYSFDIDQRAINGALVLSDKINYNIEENPLNLIFHNSWTFIYQILKIFIDLDVSIKFLNFLILFFSITMCSFGIFYISSAITKDKLFSIITVVSILLFQINFGDLDYPTLVISEHTNGMLGSAFVVLVFGLISQRKFEYAIIFSIITILTHLVIGLWLALIIFITLLIFKENKIKINVKKKSLFITFLFIIITFIYCFIQFQLNKISIPFTYDENLYKIYLNNWDQHRSKDLGINYIYIVLSLILLTLSISIIKTQTNKKFYLPLFMLQALTLHIFFSFLLYISFKIYPDLYKGIFLKVIPTRFFLLHSVVGPAIIFSFIFLYIKKNIKIKNIIFPVLILISLHPLFFYEKYEKKIINLYNNIFVNKKNYDGIFWSKVKNSNISNGLILTSNNACTKTLQKAQKPILICIESIDVIPYMPKLVLPIKEILEDIYEENFMYPKEKNRGGIKYDKTYRKVFETRSKEQWQKISNKFNLAALIVPKDWNINLDKNIEGSNYIFYKF